MIDTLSVPLKSFDLAGFFEAHRAFVARWSGEEADADASLFILTRHGETPLPMPSGIDPIKVLLQQGSLVFVPFHEPPVAQTARLIDGSQVDSEQLDIGVNDLYGLLLERHDDMLSLHPALYDGSGPVPTLDIQGSCGILDAAMVGFVGRCLPRKGGAEPVPEM
jgi:hypothetical protein